MPNFLKVDTTHLACKIRELYDELNPEDKEKYKEYMSNLYQGFTLLKNMLSRPLIELFMEHYFDEKSITPPDVQFNQCYAVILTQIENLSKDKKNEDKSKDKDKVISRINYIKLILGVNVRENIRASLNEFKELYSWDKLEKLDLNKEYFNKVVSNPSCFKEAIKLGLNQGYIEKAFDNPSYFKEALEKSISKSSIQIALDTLSLEKDKICENISSSETKSFLQQNRGCIARKSKSHPDSISFGHISPEGLVQQHLIQFENGYWVLKSGPKEQLGTKLGTTLADVAKNSESILHSPDSVKRWQNQQNQQDQQSQNRSLLLTQGVLLPSVLRDTQEEPDFFYNKSLQSSPPLQPRNTKSEECSPK
ncbi:hypothetical protein Psal006b_01782 [Piscirickettsia salmonis]|uniref:Kinase domain protein n=2 Tax=Piscirickettsia salmonis TaxID=1238 RepID=A0AAC8ZP37_PISSA|nr:hypothetical protein [Piscirickettsia salmonis]AKP73804.1 hypothetical protein PSLF89_2022 [Piscirickettsia salmonis LF-89 = ATCC VR-1361]ALB22605.1 kinase domain protein [Piscirickettsia salmonis]ALY02623.1 hypothetical protein AWE47_06980 [Piscirickettsia salmonis]AMA42167.1 hypothetical protein AWJ11_07155 [Piscirickettsia salmonis]AOS34644.1 hypothetical protein AVM72_04330 [Piscirickettsia salmonis]